MNCVSKAAFRCVVMLLMLTSQLVFKAQVSSRPDDYLSGEAFMHEGNYDAAAAAFADAVRSDSLLSSPLHPEAALQEARARFQLGEYDQAAMGLQSYVHLHPEASDALYLLAFVQQRQNHPRESLASYTAAARLVPPSAEELRRVSLNYVLLNDYPDALHWLSRATASDPQNAEAWYDLARVQMHQGRFDLAIDALRRSLSIRPNDARELGNLAKCLENQNRLDEAGDTYAAAVRIAEIDQHPVEQPFVDYGALLNTSSRFSDALRLLKRATQLAPQDPHAHEELARAELGLHHLQEAEAAMRQAVELDAQNPRLHYQLGRILRLLGKTEQASQELRTSSNLFGHTSAE